MKRLFGNVDAASLAVFRVMFGAVMLWEIARYFVQGRIHAYWIEPEFHFKYMFFGWVHPLPGEGMVILFALLGLAALGITLGLFYRVSAWVFFLGWTYAFLIEKAEYQNHIYLICLVSFLLTCVPAHQVLSLDSRGRSWPRVIPAWSLWLIRAQFAMPYIYGAVAKINADWMVGVPWDTQLQRHADLHLVGQWLTQPAGAWFIAWAGILIDGLMVPALLWRRTRLFALAVALMFHGSNSVLFPIGPFPWLMIAGTLLYLDPSWPQRLGLPGRDVARPFQVPSSITPRQQLVGALVLAWVAVQVLIPVRPHLYPGNPRWTEQGVKFSWMMMLTYKRGTTQLYASVDGGPRRAIDHDRLLTKYQQWVMVREPDLILQFAHHVADLLGRSEGRDVRVWADTSVSLNLREHQAMIDPSANLAEKRRSLASADWITELTAKRPPAQSARAARGGR